MSEGTTFKYSQEIADDFENLLKAGEEYDVIIYVGEELKEIHAHSLILRARSQYFRTVADWSEKKDGKFILKNPNVSSLSFEIILRFIYCGEVNLTNLQGPDILKLLIATDEYNIPTLISCVQDYLMKRQHEFLKQNPTDILDTIYQREDFTDLWNFCNEKICENPEILFNSDKFTSLKAPLLELFLKRDDLLLDEIVIWDSLIKWSLAQNPSVQQDVKKWDKDEITIMERTIREFIPLIRFCNISSVDFLSNVYPYKALLPEDLINEILTFHMVPDKQSNLNTQSPRLANKKVVYSEFVLFKKGEPSEVDNVSNEVGIEERKHLKDRVKDFFHRKPTRI
ncbi:BTB/POZ protein [Rhizophagus clarus]|uniref:BTB/POZ protein n=1 Tax=Rhizophagus clarus TaxID=94130 RepID=A0A8H3R5M8_9GLOM|nr:BTB/POZ protein [Rhizophagus clarus]